LNLTEELILAHLLGDQTFSRTASPYIKREYFTERTHQIIFELIEAYIHQYKKTPSKQAIEIELGKVDKLNDEEYQQAEHIVKSLTVDPKTDTAYVINTAEEWCRTRAMYNALVESFNIQKKNEREALGAIPKILQAALGVCFDTHIGHDFFADADARYDYYHQVEHKVPFDIELLNHVTRGGVSKKSLTILMAGVNVGKSAMMCHMSAANIKDGKKVLYITLEMSEEMISQRIDANLMDLTIDDVMALPEGQYKAKIKALRQLYGGDLKVKEYPTKQGGSANFRHLLNELKLKSNFVPDIIYIDYMNICMASTITGNKSGMYEYVKAVSEELRGLAVEFEVPIVTATQFNREGFKSSDPGMEDVAESFGTTATADLILALVRNEQMDAAGEILCIQLKNRYSDKGKFRHFGIGVNIEKMQFYDLERKDQNYMNAQSDLAALPDRGEAPLTPEQQNELLFGKDKNFNDLFAS
jgi:replicative DNA helicase